MATETSLQNVRDVGADGHGGLRPGVLYRSDAPHHGDGPPPLDAWPPRHVVDLRSTGEAAAAEHPLAGDDVEVHPVPMFAAAAPAALAATGEPVALEDLYLTMLDAAAPIAARVARLVAADEGPVLVHCSAGKDRTGVLVAALLAAVGVDREVIVADYVATAERVPAVVERMAHTMSPDDAAALEALAVDRPEILGAEAPTITRVLDHLDLQPGGAAGWLERAGVSPDGLEALRSRLLADD